MTISYNPSIVTQNLAFLVDTVNPKSYTNSENLFYYSENLNYSGYSNISAYTITYATSVISPIGTTSTNTVIGASTSSNYSYISQQYNTGQGGYYTFSMYAKPGTTGTITLIHGTNGFYAPNGTSTVYATVTVDLPTSTMTLRGLSQATGNNNTIADFSWGKTPANNGWTRYYITANLTTSTNLWPITSVNAGFYVGSPGNTSAANGLNMYAWGLQLEASTQMNTYTPTVGSIVPRSLIWKDISGNGNNLTLSSYNTYNNGQSMSGGVFSTNSSTQAFAAANQKFFGTASATNVSYSFTINANWYADQYYQSLFGMQSASVANTSFYYVAVLNMDAPNGPIGDLCMDFRTPTSYDRYRFGYNMLPYSNQWILLTYTFNTGTHSLYINNSLVSQQTGTSTLFPGWPSNVSNSGFAIGTNLDSARPIGNANIGWAAVYNSTLTLDQIKQNFAALRGRYGI